MDMQGYEQSLNFVFQNGNEDINNIAITGNYDSGKSSVIRSYVESHRDLSFIYVSLSYFEEVFGVGTVDENYDVTIEKKIINNLVLQIPLNNVTDSDFRIKRAFNKWSGLWFPFRLAVLFLAAVHLNSFFRDSKCGYKAY